MSIIRSIIEWMEEWRWDALQWDSLETQSADPSFAQELLSQWSRISNPHSALCRIVPSDALYPLKIQATHSGKLSWLLAQIQAENSMSLSELKSSVKSLTQRFALSGDFFGSLSSPQLQSDLDGEIYQVEITPIAGQIFLRIIHLHPEMTPLKATCPEYWRERSQSRWDDPVEREKVHFISSLNEHVSSGFHSQVLRWKEEWEELVQFVFFQNSQHVSQEDQRRVLHTWRGCFSLFKLSHLEDLCRRWEEKLQKDFRPDDFSAALREIQSSLEIIMNHLKLERSPEVEAFQLKAGVAFQNQTLDDRVSSSDQLVQWLNEALEVSSRQNHVWVYPIRIEGKNPELRYLSPGLRRSLVHLIRNAVDHGIEPPEEREALGKSLFGEITVQVQECDGSLIMSLRDDGRGMDYQKLYENAKGLGYEVSESPQNLESLVLSGGLSTSRGGSSLSGQGIGLSCVVTEVRRLQGIVSLKSKKNEGLEIQIKLPKKHL